MDEKREHGMRPGLGRRKFLQYGVALGVTGVLGGTLIRNCGSAQSDNHDQTMLQNYNYARYRPGQTEGHYESFWQRANHPTRPLGFWIRYTVFSPKGQPENAIGELWGIYFNGETQQHICVKSEFPITRCEFKADNFYAQVGESFLSEGSLKGQAARGQDQIAWDLRYDGGLQPIFFLPVDKYEGSIPAAKSLIGKPLARFHGELIVNHETIPIDNWIGSQNHNWGYKHTDNYAVAQVAGFDNDPESYLEVVSARYKLGFLWTPFLTPLVVHTAGETYALNSVMQTLKAKSSFRYFEWDFETSNDDITVQGHIHAPKEAFVTLTYYNPPGGNKYCLNTKIAACDLTLRRKKNGHDWQEKKLVAKHKVLFEILSDDLDHGVRLAL